MKTFTEYLQEQYTYTPRTLTEKQKQLQQWKTLCLKHRPLKSLTTKELLPLIENHKQKYTAQTINNQLYTLEQYYHYQVQQKKRNDHPLKNFRIKTDQKPIITQLLTQEELQALYETYPTHGHLGGQFNLYRQRNKVILGLLIYQALDSGSLQQLQVSHIDLNKGLIHIPKTTRYKHNPRTLKLESCQILELQTYIQTTRPNLIRLINAQADTQYLFPLSSNTKFSKITGSIKKSLKIENLIQLRYSRITLWKQQYNLREVQHMAGYKSLLSLEKYNQDEIEQLKQAVDKYHPF